MFSSRNGQASVEYLFIVALGLMLLIPASVIFYRFSVDSTTIIDVSKYNIVGSDIIGVAEEVYSLGDAWQTISFTLPTSVTEMWVYNDTVSELSIHYQLEGPSEIVMFSHVPLFNSTHKDCSDGCMIPISAGSNNLRLESNENGEVILRSTE